MSQTHYFTRDVPMDDVMAGEARMPQGGNAFAKFFARDVIDKAKTEALGRNAYRKIDMVRVVIPGDNGNVVERRVKPSDKIRWPRQWEAYQKMEEFVPDGTLLETWPLLTRGQIEDLKYQNIFTVEQLAEVSDEALSRLGLGARRMREHARAFIETSKTGKVPAKIVEENERLKNQIQLLTSQMAQLTAKLEIFAVKAGENVGDVENPVQHVQSDIEKAQRMAERAIIEIPDDYEQLPVGTLRKLCANITDEKVLTKVHALEIIEEYKRQEGL